MSLGGQTSIKGLPRHEVFADAIHQCAHGMCRTATPKVCLCTNKAGGHHSTHKCATPRKLATDHKPNNPSNLLLEDATIWFQLSGAWNCPVMLLPRSKADTVVVLVFLFEASVAAHQKQLPGLQPHWTASCKASATAAVMGLLLDSAFFTSSRVKSATGVIEPAAFTHLLLCASNTASSVSYKALVMVFIRLCAAAHWWLKTVALASVRALIMATLEACKNTAATQQYIT